MKNGEKKRERKKEERDGDSVHYDAIGMVWLGRVKPLRYASGKHKPII